MEPEIKLHDFFSKVDGSKRRQQEKPGLSSLPDNHKIPDLNSIVTQEGADHLRPVIEAIHKQESGGGTNARTSINGARGGMQVMPDTFRRYAKPGEDINNPDDNMRVGVRIIKDLGKKFGNDPAKIAAGYFSGDGNVNQSNGAAWKKDHADGNGKRVSSYVSDILSKLGMVSEAHAEKLPSSKPDLSKAPKWNEIAAKPGFVKLSDEDKRIAKQAYFNHYVRPHAGNRADDLLRVFMEQNDGQGNDASLTDRVISAAKDFATNSLGINVNAKPSGNKSIADMAEESAADGENTAAHQIPGAPVRQATYNTALIDPNFGIKPTEIFRKPDRNGVLSRIRNTANQDVEGQVEQGKILNALTNKELESDGSRTVGEVYSDTGAQLVEGAHTIAGAIPNLFAPEGDIAEFFNKGAEHWRDQQSSGLKARIKAADEKISAADAEGISAQIVEASNQYFNDPGLAARFIITNLPSMIPGIAAGKVAHTAALARGASKVQAGTAATTAAGVTGAALNAGGARGEAFQDIKNTLIQQGMSPQEAEDMALKDSRVVAAVGGLAGFVSGKTGLEKALFAKEAGKTASTGAFKAGAKGVGAELAGEQLEEVAPKFATNLMASEYDNRSPGKDVGRTIVETGIGSGPGAVLAGGVAAANASNPGIPEEAQQDIETAEKSSTSSTSSTGVDSGMTRPAQQEENPDINEHPTTQAANAIVRDLSRAAGIPEDSLLPEKQQQAPEPSNVSDNDVLNFADSRYQQLREKRDGNIQTGIGETGIVDQDVPGEGLTATEQEELSGLENARGDIDSLRAMYGLNDQPSIPSANEPETTEYDKRPVLNDRVNTTIKNSDRKAKNSYVAPDLSGRSTEELYQQLRDAKDRGVMRAIANELQNRDEAESIDSNQSSDVQVDNVPNVPNGATDIPKQSETQTNIAPGIEQQGAKEITPVAEQVAQEAELPKPKTEKEARARKAKPRKVKETPPAVAPITQEKELSAPKATSTGITAQIIRAKARLLETRHKLKHGLLTQESKDTLLKKENDIEKELRELRRRVFDEDEQEQPVTQAANDINAAAHEAATSPENKLPEPTEAQKEAGNYKKGHVNFDGLDISIENPNGSKRTGTDRNGQSWSVDMTAHYGYLKRSMGADGDQVDVYVHENPAPGSPVFVFDQYDNNGKFDEHKAVVGVATQEEAQKIYDAHFSDGTGPKRRRGVTAMPVNDFKEWAQNGDTKKPLSKPKTEKEARARKAKQKNPKAVIEKQQEQVTNSDTPVERVGETQKNEQEADLFRSETEKQARAALRAKKTKEKVNGIKTTETKQTETPGTKESAADETPVVTPFSNNKIFTADKVAAARERLKSKLGTLNSGIDPEILHDGLTLAGAYIESGTRSFSAYSKAMIADLGEKIRPYLRSFYESARYYPGLDTTGMTTAAEIDLMEKQGTAAHTKPVEGVSAAIGEVVKHKRTKERKPSDLTLVNDYGVSNIDGYDNETGEGASGIVKRKFLQDTKKYLVGVQKILADGGFIAATDRKGKPIKPVSVNESGIATSGDVSLTMYHPGLQHGIYIHIGGSSMRGMVTSTKSGVSMMMRVTKENDPYGGDQNRWMPVNLTATELAGLAAREVEKIYSIELEKPSGQEQDVNLSSKEKDDDEITQSKPVPAGDKEQVAENDTAGGGNSKPVEPGLAENGQGADSFRGISGSTEDSGGTGTGSTDTAGNGSPVELGKSGSDGVESVSAGTEQPNGAVEDHTIDADEIGKGGLSQKYKDNVAAIKILKEIEAESRLATPAERKALAKYVGWGAMKGPFDPANKAWAKQHAELKELLTDAEFNAARASTRNAHFTSPVAVNAMFSALNRLGVTGGRILEPSVGVGNFFGLMPNDLRNASQLHGVELDSLTSRLVAALYPKAKIAKSTGFEDFVIPSEYFDVVIGNPPFGNEPLVDRERTAYSGFSIHNYFLAKSIDKLRPGGVMAVVVSHNFLDAKDGRARKWIGERANLVGGVRLPNTAFKENAGTEVVTDILIFQKRGKDDSVESNGSKWLNVVDQVNINTKTGEPVTHKVNEFFVNNPKNVLGKPSAAGSMYGPNEYTVEQDGDIKDGLDKWVGELPQNIFSNINRSSDSNVVDMAIPDGVKVGSYFIDESGKVMRRGDDVMGNRTAEAWKPKAESQVGRMKGMIAIRDALRTQMRLERSLDSTEQEIEANRAILNAAYDDFVKKYKHINSTTNRSVFLDDTEGHLIQGLEFDYDRGISKATAEKEGIEQKEPSATKADIFDRRVAFPQQDYLTVTTAKDALLASLNYRGRVDPVYMSEVYSKPINKIYEELGDLVYEDPQAGFVAADEYLSGDVKTKLTEAEAAAQNDLKFKRNVEALQKVIPKDKTPSEISVNIGASFVPVDIYKQFIKHITGTGAEFTYIKATGGWAIAFSGGADTALNTGRFGTQDISAQGLFELTMQGRGAVVKKIVRNADGSTTTILLEKETEAAREKQNAIKAEWQKWLWQEPERADKIAAIYNDKMNRIVNRKFDGLHLTFPGMTPVISLLNHQKNGVWRGLQSYQVLYDHVVGAGKTFEMATLAMEMRRLGIARKPLFVVPNHLTLQWLKEFTKLYPGSNVLAATPEDFSKDNRERLFAKIVTGDWDAVIIGHSSLKKIGLPEATETSVLNEQVKELAEAIEEMKRARGDSRIVSDMERIKRNIEAKMKDKLASVGARSKVVTFDELGIDAMFVDEMHEFKNLSYHSTMDRVPGMGNPNGSAKAFDMFVKVRWLFDSFGDKTPFITATGTPVSNSLVEMFNMQRYMQYPTLKKNGLHVFDAWAKQFGNVESVYEVAPSGSGYRQSNRFSKFTNLPALMSLFNEFADTVTLDDLKQQEESAGKKFPVPKISGGRPTLLVAKRSPLVSDFMGVPTAETDENGNIKFKVDLDKPIVMEKDDKTNKWVIRAEEQNSFGLFETQEEAQLKIVELALSPVVTIDPGSILGRFANLRNLTRETKGKVNALSLTGEANKAGLDYRLINPHAPDFEGSKINMAVDNMIKVYRQWSQDKGVQLVFCDLSIPLSARANLSSKARGVYIRGDDGVSLARARGTMHTTTGHEDLPYFIIQRGTKDKKQFDVYDAAAGFKVHSGFPSKTAAIESTNAILNDEKGIEKWLVKRDSTGEIEQTEIDEFNGENDVDTTDMTLFITREDIAGMSGSSKFSVYDDIKAKLVAKGIPEREIAFIHDYSTPVAKDKLFKAVNAGDIRFLLGSTPKMGAGTNVQKRLVGLHHIDAPWRPSDLEQREGRIIRRGNSLYERDPDGFEVFIGRYATEQTYDTRRWQILEHKARGIEQLRNYDGTTNEIDDIDGEAANAADMKAAASGDPLILEETKLRNEVRRLERLQASHADEVLAMTRKAREAKYYSETSGPNKVKEITALIAKTKQHPLNKEGFSPITVHGTRPISDKDSAHEAISQAFNQVRTHFKDVAEIQYRGLNFRLEYLDGTVILRTPTGSNGYWHQTDPFSPSGFITRLKNYIDRLEDVLEETEQTIKKSVNSIGDLEKQSKEPFKFSKELEDARENHRRVQRALMAKGPEVPEDQKALVSDSIEKQKSRLRELGYGHALDELYNDNDFVIREPVKLDYEKIKQRPGTTEAQREAGRNAYSDLLERIARRAGGKILGLALAKDFREQGGSTLIGQEIKSSGDLASIAQVLRDPRFETFRVFFIKDGKIIHHTGLTSRLPSAVNLINAKPGESFADASAAYTRSLHDQMVASKADGYFLLHNHPSGRADPSRSDIKVTKFIADNVPGFKGHVVIDSDEYAVIESDGTTEVFYKELSGGHKGGASIPHDLLQFGPINRPEKLAELGKSLQNKDGYFTLIGLSAPNIVTSITEVPLSVLDGNGARSIAIMRSFARHSGSTALATVASKNDLHRFRSAISHGVLMDATDDEGNTLRETMSTTIASPSLFEGKAENRRAISVDQTSPDYSGRKAQKDLFKFFGDDKPKSLKNFGTYHKTLSTQYHKALIDKHYGKVFAYANAMQNEVSLASVRPAELAPGVLPRVDDVKSALKGLIKGKENSKHMQKVAGAIFAGTLAGGDVTKGKVWSDKQLRDDHGLDDTGIALYRQARAAIDASIDELAAAEGYAMAQGIVSKELRRIIIDEPGAAEGLLVSELNKTINLLNVAINSAKAKGNEKRQADLESVQAMNQDTLNKVEKIFSMARDLKKGGYAPLMRFGKWTVTVQAADPLTGAVLRDEDGVPETMYFGKFETEGEALNTLAKMKTKYKDRDDITISAGIDSESAHELYAGISPETIALFGEAIGAGEVAQKYYQVALSERSSLKRRLERKGTPGYNDDLPRVLSNFLTSNGRFAAQRYYLRDLNNSIKYIPKEKGDVKDEAIKLKQFIINPGDPAAPLSTVMFAWFLGGSVAAAMVNMTQPVMMTAPYLSQFGATLATSELTKAIPYAMGRKEISDANLREAMRRASHEGVVDAQEIFHLYSLGAQSVASNLASALSHVPFAGKAIKESGDGARARINSFLTLWGSMFSLAEKFNRKLTFVAAWNMAIKNKESDPYGFAVRAVNETQGIYSKVNRPNWARNPAGRVILTFKQFSLMYVELLSRMWKRGGPEGKRAALIMLAVLTLAAGEEGLPFVQDLDDLIDTIGQLFGLDTNMRKNKREWAYSALSKELGDLFLYGASSQMPLDISGRLGLGNFIPGTALLKKSDELMRARNIIELFGPAAGMGSQLGDAYDAASEGNTYKAMQNLAPKAVKDILAAEEMARKGYSSDFKGRKVVETGLSDAVVKGIGFNPTKIANVHRKTMPLQQDISLHRITEASIANQWARGVADDDNDMIKNAQDRRDNWNKKNPDMPIAINGTQIRDRVRALATDKDTRILKNTPREIRGRIGLDLVE